MNTTAFTSHADLYDALRAHTGTVVVASEIARVRLMALGCAARDIVTVDELWQELHCDQAAAMGRAISTSELRAWLREQDVSGQLAALIGDEQALGELASHLIYLDTERSAAGERGLDQQIQQLRRDLENEGLYTQGAWRHLLVDCQATSRHRDVVLAPVGVMDSPLARLVRLLSGQDSSFTRYEASPPVRYAAEHATDEVQRVVDAMSQLLGAGVAADRIGVFGASGQLIEQIIEEAGLRQLPTLSLTRAGARDSAVGNLLLRIVGADQLDARTIDELVGEHSHLGLATDDLEHLRELRGADVSRQVLALHALGQRVLAVTDPNNALAHAWLDRLAQMALPGASASVGEACNVRSAARVAGQLDGVACLPLSHAATLELEWTIVCGLAAGQFPPASAGLWANDRPDWPALLDAALTSAPNVLVTRRLGSDTFASPSYERIAAIAQPCDVLSQSVPQPGRARLRQAARMRERHPQVRSAMHQIDRARLPVGYLGGERSSFSVTELEQFLVCPYGWFVRYVLQPSGRANLRAQQGHYLHEILAKILLVEPDERVAELHDLWDADHLFSPQMSQVHLHRIERVVRRYCALDWPWPTQHAEIALSGHVLDDFPDVKVTGRADRIDAGHTSGLLVIDYKSRRSLRKPAQAESARVTQLQDTLYPLLASKQLSEQALGMIYVSIFHADHAGRVHRPEPTLANRFLSVGALEQQTERALAAASEAVERIIDGDVRVADDCPPWCAHRLLSDTAVAR